MAASRETSMETRLRGWHGPKAAGARPGRARVRAGASREPFEAGGPRPGTDLGSWSVAGVRDGKNLGEVVEVIEPPSGVGHALLNVRIGLDPPEHRLIPLVPDIVPFFDRHLRELYVDPPEGLLELDSKRSLSREDDDELVWLRRELQKIASHSGGDPNQLPCRSRLESLGRKDVQLAVESQGGHYEVAARLGIRPYKTPPGYWDADSIEDEVFDFLEGLWRRQEGPAGVAETHELTGEERVPGAIATRLLPNSRVLADHGRQDLIYAIKMNGGFRIVAKELDRVLYSERAVRRHRLFEDFAYFSGEMRRAMLRPECLESCPSADRLPTQKTLRDMKRNDLDAAVGKHGGYIEVASRMGLRSSFRRPRGYWACRENLLKEVRSFASSSLDSDEGVACPRYAELERAGRHDLKYGIEIHGGRMAVAELLGGAHGNRAEG